MKFSLWQGFIFFFTNTLLYGSLAVITFAASNLHEKGLISVGDISAFFLYTLLLLQNFMVLAFFFANFLKMAGASQKMIELMKDQPIIQVRGGIQQEDSEVKGVVKFIDVNFNYPSKPDVQVTKNVNLEFEENKVTAIVGESGCGKSTIISLILRFYDPTSGQVLFNGIDVKSLDPVWYKRQIAIVQQEPVLFSGTIRDNICYGSDFEVSLEDLRDACRKANALDFIEDKQMFPDGFETVVGERGVKLSGGQKQRVAIARALIKKPKLILLDEATSALDAESEFLVQQALSDLMKTCGQTIVVIAHRLSTIRQADTIVVMKEGEVNEQGTHD